MKAVSLLSLLLTTAVAFAPPRPALHSPTSFALNAEDKPGFFGRVFGKGESKEESTTAVLEPETTSEVAVTADGECEVPEEKELNEIEKLFKQIKDAGVAGSISLFLWEGAFWAISIPVAIFGYTSVSGHFPDLSDKDDLAKVGAEAFAFANVARLALPVRIALAISTTGWVQENIVDRFLTKEEDCDPEEN